MSILAYKRTIRETENPRQIERRILLAANVKLESFAAAYDAAQDSADRLGVLSQGLREALVENQKVWFAFRADLAGPQNTLPQGLRAALLSLSHWVDRQTNAILGGTARVTPLIDINRNIIAGLAGDAGDRPAAAGAF
ncbi:flagellar biosynthesis regulator FlaF [Frigidibacter sp. MR17.24]|uniref:flagellar biosynthesis regulator FlaF n=1 Tax=Frigidibacter sp. MR17.24 TaxID=3127345 RepID=UPI003012AA53